jgi:hypothetical protein
VTRFREEIENEDGWTDWIRPLPGYKVACCDCGLVHNIEAKLDEEGRIIFRASRNARSTAARRRKHTSAPPAPVPPHIAGLADELDNLKFEGYLLKAREAAQALRALALRGTEDVGGAA